MAIFVIDSEILLSKGPKLIVKKKGKKEINRQLVIITKPTCVYHHVSLYYYRVHKMVTDNIRIYSYLY